MTYYFDPARKALVLVAADGTETVVTDRSAWKEHLKDQLRTRSAWRRMEQQERGRSGGYGYTRSGKK